MKGVAVAVDLLIDGKRAVAGCRVGVMARDGHVREKESLIGGQAVDPGQHSPHSRFLVDAEAGFAVPANAAGVLHRVEAAVPNHLLHAEIAEAPGVEQAAAESAGGQFSGQ